MDAKTMEMDKKSDKRMMKENQPEGNSPSLSQKKDKNETEVLGSPDEEAANHETKDTDIHMNCRCSTKKVSRQERVELSQKLQEALSSQNWELAERLLMGTDTHTLNDALCLSLDSIWFLSTREEYDGLTGLLGKIVSSGASNFTRATLRTSFLASCVSACQSGRMSLSDTVAFVSQRKNVFSTRRILGKNLWRTEQNNAVLCSIQTAFQYWSHLGKKLDAV